MSNHDRRKFLQTGLAVSAAMTGAGAAGSLHGKDAGSGSGTAANSASTGTSTKRFRMRKPYRLIVNDDGGRGYWNWVAPLTTAQYLDALFGPQVEGKPVDALFWCGLQNPSGTGQYGTKVGEVRGSRKQKMSASDWQMLATLRGMLSRGDDPLAVICARGHELGKDVWLSFRVNDHHHVGSPKSSKSSQLYEDRLDLRLEDGRWDYTKSEVRDHVYKLLREAYLDYDVDGVEWDFMRSPGYFPKDKIGEGKEQLNALMKKLRALADEAAQKKGRPQGLAVRLPSWEPGCADVGLDWRTWVKEGWVDVLTASCFQSAEHEADLAPFVEGCRGSKTLVHWCVESTAGFIPNVEFGATRYYGGAPNGPSTEHYRAMALGAYEQGVDGLYFFNLHFAFERYATHPEVAFLHELHDPERLRARDHTYLVSRQTHDSHNRFFKSAPLRPLPRTLTAEKPECSFVITVGADLKRAAAEQRLASTRLRLLLSGLTPGDEFGVWWDGKELAGELQPPLMPGAGVWQQWSGLHWWVADLARLDRAPDRGKHECTVRVKQRNPQIEGGIGVDFAELDVRYWHRPGMPAS
ncbi:MAG: hypothetical protein FJW26_08620 [Acidimicrobiia bacterium]|nr:hypothetical protein [Acidimicrobiia bacterium]